MQAGRAHEEAPGAVLDRPDSAAFGAGTQMIVMPLGRGIIQMPVVPLDSHTWKYHNLGALAATGPIFGVGIAPIPLRSAKL